MKLSEITKEFAAAIVVSCQADAEHFKTLFETHPDVDVFFITADGQAFFAENMADAHGQKLKPRDVLEITREEVFGETETSFADGLGDDEQAAAEQAAADKAAAEQAAADKAAAEQAAADKAAAEQAAADKAAAEQAAADKAAADQAAADQANKGKKATTTTEEVKL